MFIERDQIMFIPMSVAKPTVRLAADCPFGVHFKRGIEDSWSFEFSPNVTDLMLPEPQTLYLHSCLCDCPVIGSRDAVPLDASEVEAPCSHLPQEFVLSDALAASLIAKYLLQQRDRFMKEESKKKPTSLCWRPRIKGCCVRSRRNLGL